MKTVLVVPGYQEDFTFRDYKSVLTAIESKGYKAKFVPITWKRKTIADWVTELEKEYAKYEPKDVVLAGFSYGAMTAFVAAAKQNPAELWLFSLSPYFTEDLESKNMKQTWLNGIGHRRVSAFAALNFKELAKQVQCKALLFIGQLEMDKYKVMGERSDAAAKILSNNERIVISGVGHDVSHKEYVEAIRNAI